MICSLILTGLTLTGEKVYAAPTANFSISVGGNATLGGTVSVTISVKGSENMSYAQVSLDYASSTSILEYQSGADSGGSGRVNLLFDCGSGQKSVSRTITFKAVGTGKASLSLDNAKATPADANSGDWMNASAGGGASVTVGESKNLSGDAHVASIEVSPGTLQPSFNADVFKYTMEVENDVTSIAVTATASHQAARITSVTGASDLKVGANKVSVVCTAENGGTAVYVITVTRKAASAEQSQATTTKAQEEATTKAPESADDLTCELNGATYYIGQKFSEKSIPEGFESADIQYQNQAVKGAQFTNNNEIQLVYLLNSEKENGQFYVYYPASGLVSELVQVSFYEGSSIYLLDPSAYGITIPVDLMETVFNIDDRELTGYTLANPKAGVGDPYFDEEADTTLERVSASPDQFVLLFGLAKDGGVYWYSYDKQEKTLQRLVVFASEVEEEEAEAVEETTTTGASESAFKKMLDTVKVYRIILLGAAAIIVLLIVLCVLLFMNGKKKAAEDGDSDDEIEEKEKKSAKALEAGASWESLQKPKAGKSQAAKDVDAEATKLMPSKEIRKKTENQEKPEKMEKSEKIKKSNKEKKSEKQEKPEKIEKRKNSERTEKTEKPEKLEKPKKQEKGKKPEKVEKKPSGNPSDDSGLEFFDIDDL